MIEHKPCPFCGHADAAPYQEYERAKWGMIVCSYCGACGPEVRTQYAMPEDHAWYDAAWKEWDAREDGLERDALRYRWLRIDERWLDFDGQLTCNEFDAAVDAWLAAKKENE
jgi:hypothetical protein